MTCWVKRLCRKRFLEPMPSVLFGRSDVNRNRGILQALQAAGFASDPGNNCVTRTGSNIFLLLSEAPLYTDIFPVFYVNKLKDFTYINTHMYIICTKKVSSKFSKRRIIMNPTGCRFCFFRRNVKKSVEPTGLKIEEGNPPTIYSICRPGTVGTTKKIRTFALP